MAEQILGNGEADMCGMTRAMICDPKMPEKAEAGDVVDITGLHRMQPSLHRTHGSRIRGVLYSVP